jgi:hypothetical protein
MKCAIPPIPDKYLDIAVSPEIGVETRLFYTTEAMRRVCTIEQDDVASGVLTPDRTYAPPTDAAKGRDLQVLALDSISSDVPVVITLAVTFDDASNGTATATFSAPQAVDDQDNNFPAGIAVDLKLKDAQNVDVTATRTVRTVTGLTSIVGGDVGNKFAVVACPERASYVLIANINNRDIQVPVAKTVTIASGYDGARWTKKGRSEPPKIDLKANYTGYGTGLPRISGQRVTIMMETYKDDKVLTERMIVGGYRPEIKLAKPDGNSLSEATATGEYESGSFAVFV